MLFHSQPALMADVNHLTIELDHARRRWWHWLIGRR
jgi:hypothetical protein